MLGNELAELALHGKNGMSASNKVDQALAVVLMRAAQTPEDKEYTAKLLIERRNRHRTWITVTQRKWQQHTRRPQRARHHDSVEIRERYVRCGT